MKSRTKPALQRLNPDLPVDHSTPRLRMAWAIEGAVWRKARSETLRQRPAARRHSHFLLNDCFNLRLAGFRFPVYLDSMKTTIDIPDAALADAMRFTGAKTKREAVVKALEEYNRQQLVKEVVASFGTWDIATNDEIEAGDMEEIASGKPKIGIWTIQ
jgi:Bacterial antitoxin of type II TA system, VapB